MTVYIDFQPSSTAPFQFGATLDGAIYTVVVKWNLFGQRWYLEIYDVSGTLIVCKARAGSPIGYDISLTGGYFTTQLVWREQNNQFEVIG